MLQMRWNGQVYLQPCSVTLSSIDCEAHSREGLKVWARERTSARPQSLLRVPPAEDVGMPCPPWAARVAATNDASCDACRIFVQTLLAPGYAEGRPTVRLETRSVRLRVTPWHFNCSRASQMTRGGRAMHSSWLAGMRTDQSPRLRPCLRLPVYEIPQQYWIAHNVAKPRWLRMLQTALSAR